MGFNSLARLMQEISKLIKKPERKDAAYGPPRNARDAVVKEATELINAGRKGTEYKPTTPKLVALKTRHLSLFDLQWHVQECKKSKNFSACFYGKLKVQSKP
jgi:hypothetical protein